jgi:hypothetical protein
MASDIVNPTEAKKDIEETAVNVDIVLEDQELSGENSSLLKQKIKKDCDSRKRLEEKLEQARVDKQVKEFDFDDFD